MSVQNDHESNLSHIADVIGYRLRYGGDAGGVADGGVAGGFARPEA
jgi:hypothetical protein